MKTSAAFKKTASLSGEQEKTSSSAALHGLRNLLEGDVFFRACFLQSPLPKALLSASGERLLANNSFLELLANSNVPSECVNLLEYLEVREHAALCLALEELANSSRDFYSAEVMLFSNQSRAAYAELQLCRLQVPGAQSPLLLLELKDVSERRVAVEALVESEHTYRSLVERSNDLIWSLDIEGRWTFLNYQAAKDIYGYDRAVMLGRQFDTFAADGRAQSDRLAFERIIGGQECVTYETEHSRRDGTVVHLRFHGIAVENAKGKIVGATGTAVDISELKQAEKELASQRVFLRQIIDLNPNLIYAKDTHGRYVLVNQAMADAYGVTKAHLLGRSDVDLNREAEEVEVMRQVEQDILISGRQRVLPEDKIIDSQGRLRYVETVKKALRDEHGRSAALLGVSTDVTERRNAERLLRELSDVISAGVGGGLFDAVTEHLQRTEGVEYACIANFLDRTMHEAEVLSFCGKAEDCEFPRTIPLTPSAFEDVVPHECFTRDVDERSDEPFESSLAALGIRQFTCLPLLDSEQRPHAFILLGASEALVPHAFREESLRIVGNRISVEIERLRKESERAEIASRAAEVERFEGLAVLASGVAHDFNNLLTRITGHVALAKREVDESSSVQTRLANIEASAAQATLLTEQMLIYAGKNLITPSGCDMNREVPLLVERIRSYLPLTFQFQAESNERLGAHIDLVHLERALKNLLLNAAEAIDSSGEVVVRLGSERSHSDGSSWVYLEIEDNGVGMDERTVQRIFDPFFSTKFPGRGMGLAEVRGVVRKHDGRIEVRSQPNAGTRVRVLLPQLSNQSAEMFSEIEAPSRLQQKSTVCEVLLVEDERAVRQVGKEVLKVFGCKVRLAKDKPAAMRLLRRSPARINLVLLDMAMPGIDGEEIFNEIKEIRPDLPIAVCGGVSEIEIPNSVRERMLGFVQKPFRQDELARVVYRSRLIS